MNIWSYHLTSVDYLNDLRRTEAFEEGLATGWWATMGEAFFAMLTDRKETLEEELQDHEDQLTSSEVDGDEDAQNLIREDMICVRKDLQDWLNPESWDITDAGDQIFYVGGDEDVYARTVSGVLQGGE